MLFQMESYFTGVVNARRTDSTPGDIWWTAKRRFSLQCDKSIITIAFRRVYRGSFLSNIVVLSLHLHSTGWVLISAILPAAIASSQLSTDTWAMPRYFFGTTLRLSSFMCSSPCASVKHRIFQHATICFAGFRSLLGHFWGFHT
jgi:hypothetical protein